MSMIQNKSYVPFNRSFNPNREEPFSNQKFDRRDTFHYFYLPVDCPHAKLCKNGFCPLSHTKLEKIFHPIVYKTYMCQVKNASMCGYHRRCAFYHDETDRVSALKNWTLWEERWKSWRQRIHEIFYTKTWSVALIKKICSIMRVRCVHEYKDTINTHEGYKYYPMYQLQNSASERSEEQTIKYESLRCSDTVDSNSVLTQFPSLQPDQKVNTVSPLFHLYNLTCKEENAEGLNNTSVHYNEISSSDVQTIESPNLLSLSSKMALNASNTPGKSNCNWNNDLDSVKLNIQYTLKICSDETVTSNCNVGLSTLQDSSVLALPNLCVSEDVTRMLDSQQLGIFSTIPSFSLPSSSNASVLSRNEKVVEKPVCENENAYKRVASTSLKSQNLEGNLNDFCLQDVHKQEELNQNVTSDWTPTENMKLSHPTANPSPLILNTDTPAETLVPNELLNLSLDQSSQAVSALYLPIAERCSPISTVAPSISGYSPVKRCNSHTTESTICTLDSPNFCSHNIPLLDGASLFDFYSGVSSPMFQCDSPTLDNDSCVASKFYSNNKFDAIDLTNEMFIQNGEVDFFQMQYAPRENSFASGGFSEKTKYYGAENEALEFLPRSPILASHLDDISPFSFYISEKCSDELKANIDMLHF